MIADTNYVLGTILLDEAGLNQLFPRPCNLVMGTQEKRVYVYLSRLLKPFHRGSKARCGGLQTYAIPDQNAEAILENTQVCIPGIARYCNRRGLTICFCTLKQWFVFIRAALA